MKETGAKGLAYLLVTEEGVKSPIAKFLTEDEISGLVALAEAQPGDLIGFVADTPEIVAKALGFAAPRDRQAPKAGRSECPALRLGHGLSGV